MSLINISKLSVTDTVCFLFTNQSRLSSEAVSKNISLTDTSVCAVTNTYHQPHIELRTQTRARSLAEFCLVSDRLQKTELSSHTALVMETHRFQCCDQYFFTSYMHEKERRKSRLELKGGFENSSETCCDG